MSGWWILASVVATLVAAGSYHRGGFLKFVAWLSYPWLLHDHMRAYTDNVAHTVARMNAGMEGTQDEFKDIVREHRELKKRFEDYHFRLHKLEQITGASVEEMEAAFLRRLKGDVLVDGKHID